MATINGVEDLFGKREGPPPCPSRYKKLECRFTQGHLGIHSAFDEIQGHPGEYVEIIWVDRKRK